MIKCVIFLVCSFHWIWLYGLCLVRWSIWIASQLRFHHSRHLDFVFWRQTICLTLNIYRHIRLLIAFKFFCSEKFPLIQIFVYLDINISLTHWHHAHNALHSNDVSKRRTKCTLRGSFYERTFPSCIEILGMHWDSVLRLFFFFSILIFILCINTSQILLISLSFWVWKENKKTNAEMIASTVADVRRY